MNYHLADDNYDGYIIIADNMYYNWFSVSLLNNMPNLANYDGYKNTTDTIEIWLENLPKHRMRLLASFTNYDEVKITFPELFI